jgi:hypothetical protein
MLNLKPYDNPFWDFNIMTYPLERRKEVFDAIAKDQKLGSGKVLRLVLNDQDKGPPWTARTWS